MSPSHVMLSGTYDYRLVALSVIIAVFASYAALDLGGRVTVSRGWARSAWLVGGASAMGLGIWSMHYIGMLAFSMSVPMAYDWPTVLLSLLAAVLASATALFVVSLLLTVVWSLVAPDSWGTLAALGGNALVTTALVAAAFVFYQDRYRWWGEMRAALQAHLNRQKAMQPKL